MFNTYRSIYLLWSYFSSLIPKLQVVIKPSLANTSSGCLLVDLTHCVAFDIVDKLEDSRNLVWRHLLLQLGSQRFQFKRWSLLKG